MVAEIASQNAGIGKQNKDIYGLRIREWWRII